MVDPFVGEIRMFAGEFPPSGWALCDGQILSVAQNEALFSLLGSSYGGDGQSTFGLPDLRGRIPIHYGSGPGLSTRSLGQKGGAENETISLAQLPSHEHSLQAAVGAGDSELPAGRQFATAETQQVFYRERVPEQELSQSIVQEAGGGQPHDNVMPFICVNFIIALFGVLPS